MALDDRQGNKVGKDVRKEDTPGTRVDPYPYLGIVKNNLDPTRCGRVQVWVSDFGGNPDDPKNWRTVSYASPFMGSTNVAGGSAANSWTESPHTYGMWMVPPDIGVEVLVIFLAGDPLRGFWFACVNSQISRYMLPGMAGAPYPESANASADVKKAFDSSTAIGGADLPAIVTEFNPSFQDFASNPAFVNIPKPIHEPQQTILVTQGLDRDKTRGILTSSSQRETPSNVFGISTPGRAVNDPGLDPAYLEKVKAGTLTQSDYAVKSRKGGHSFIMDDGDIHDKNRVVRIRSSSGHQIVMNDSENTLYVSNNAGTVWMEFTAAGKLQIYAENGYDLRSSGDINFHCDTNINFQAKGKVNIKSGDSMQFENKSFALLSAADIVLSAAGTLGLKSGGAMTLDSGAAGTFKAAGDLSLTGAKVNLNSGGGGGVTAPTPIPEIKYGDSSFKSDKKIWVNEPEKLTSITTGVPCHEPSNRPPVAATPTAPKPESPAASASPPPGNPPVQATGPQDHAGEFTGASGTPVSNAITLSNLRSAPFIESTVGVLNTNQMTSMFAQVSQNAVSGFINTSTYGIAPGVGSYGLNISSLISSGLVKSSVSSMAQLNLSSNWIQGSLTSFISNGQLQQQTMSAYTTGNYNALCINGIINSQNIGDPAQVSGWLSVAHVLGPQGTYGYAQSGINASLGNALFQQGRYSSSMATQVSAIITG